MNKVLIIGSGFSGMGLAIQLQNAAIHDFVILEKAEEVGGTWRENTYPGAECDIPSALYSYSFEHNDAWEYKWSEQPQIFAYQKHVAEKHKLYKHIRFGQEVQSASYDESRKLWTVTTQTGEVFEAQHLVSAVGQLHHPSTPSFEGQDQYQGAHFHSANWDHSVDLSGKKVAVIGNAASALQFIPQIAKQVSNLTVFQRSANWVLPKQDRPYKPWEQWLSGKLPIITKLYRLKIWLRGEVLLFKMMTGNKLAQKIGKKMGQRYLNNTISDPALREKLTPDYPIGAKRILFSDDYYDALARNNVELVTESVQTFTESGITRSDGSHEDYDAVIYGTGFKSNPFLAPMEIKGLNGLSLREHWNDGAQAYLGMTTSHFPNLFMMYGPNTNLGHNSIIIMSESQAKYIVECIQNMDRNNWKQMSLKPSVEASYNQELQQRLNNTVWSQASDSWYKDGDKITNNWAGTTYEYIKRTRNVDWNAFQVQ